MLFNLKEKKPELIKILDTRSQVTSLRFGPFDNGHVLIGL